MNTSNNQSDNSRETHEKIRIEILDTALTERYYEELARVFSRNDRIIKIFLAITSSTTVAGWMIFSDSQIYPIGTLFWKIVSGISVLIAISSPFQNYEKKAAWAVRLRFEYDAIKNDYEMLWLKRKSLLESEIQNTMSEINKKVMGLSQLEHNLPEVDKKLLEKCQAAIIEQRGL